MKIIIVGAGRIGSNLCEALSEENHEVYLIELDEYQVEVADSKLDAKVVLGNGADPEVLQKVNVAQADLVIAVTMSDETNLIICSLASFFGAKRQIARVRNLALSSVIEKSTFEDFKIHQIINPERVAANAIVKAIEAPGSREVGDFANGKILLRAFDVLATSPLNGHQIGEFREEDFPWPFLVIAVRRNNEVVFPKGDTAIQQGDRIYVLLPPESLGEFLIFINPDAKKTKKVIIYGASTIGEYVASVLKENIREILLIEEDISKAERIADKLDTVRVMQGAGTEKDMLKESGIQAADVFVAASDNDHANFISSVLAKKMGAKRTIIITHQSDFLSIIDDLDVDVIINPKSLAVEQILSTVRGKGINAVTKLMDCDAEALEFTAENGAVVTKYKIKDINFPEDSIIGAVCRGDEVVLVTGDTEIKKDEKVIVFCQGSAIKKLQSLFTNRSIF